MGNAVATTNMEMLKERDQRARLEARKVVRRAAAYRRAVWAIAHDRASLLRLTLEAPVAGDWAVPHDELQNLCAEAAARGATSCLRELIDHAELRGAPLGMLQTAELRAVGGCVDVLREVLRPLTAAARAEANMQSRLTRAAVENAVENWDHERLLSELRRSERFIEHAVERRLGREEYGRREDEHTTTASGESE